MHKKSRQTAAHSQLRWALALSRLVTAGLAGMVLAASPSHAASPDGASVYGDPGGKDLHSSVQSAPPALEADGRSVFGLSPALSGGLGPNDGRVGISEGNAWATPQPSYAGEPPPTPPLGLRFFQLPEERFRGIPAPLVRQSWGHRPWSLGVLFGFIEGDALIDDWVYQDNGVIGGFRIGWDHQNYWGLEMRFAWASLDTYNGWRAEQAAGYPNAQAIYPGGSNDMFFWDTCVMWYPTGDTRWRPYFSAGLGLAAVDFADALGTQWTETSFALPLTLGLKYRCTDCVALRLEATENLIFGSRPMGFFENLSVTGGVEWRFGGSRRAYWPWNPGRHYW